MANGKAYLDCDTKRFLRRIGKKRRYLRDHCTNWFIQRQQCGEKYMNNRKKVIQFIIFWQLCY